MAADLEIFVLVIIIIDDVIMAAADSLWHSLSFIFPVSAGRTINSIDLLSMAGLSRLRIRCVSTETTISNLRADY